MSDIYIIPSQDIIINGMDLMEFIELAETKDEEGLKEMLKEYGIEYK